MEMFELFATVSSIATKLPALLYATSAWTKTERFYNKTMDRGLPVTFDTPEDSICSWILKCYIDTKITDALKQLWKLDWTDCVIWQHRVSAKIKMIRILLSTVTVYRKNKPSMQYYK